jgi:hypothetical protein
MAGGSAPPMAAEYAIGFIVLVSIASIVRIRFADSWWINFIPGGVAFAVGKSERRWIVSALPDKVFPRRDSLTKVQASTIGHHSPWAARLAVPFTGTTVCTGRKTEIFSSP